jgi:type I restriction enzyme R subunit
MIKEVMEKIKLEKPLHAPDYVWNAYAAVEASTGDTLSLSNRSASGYSKPKDELTALVSLIRRACGIDSELKPFDKTINENFQNWIFKQNAGQHNRFTQEQMDWLRMIKDHIVSS